MCTDPKPINDHPPEHTHIKPLRDLFLKRETVLQFVEAETGCCCSDTGINVV